LRSASPTKGIRKACASETNRGLVYQKAKAAGVGREIPTEWFLQEIRD